MKETSRYSMYVPCLLCMQTTPLSVYSKLASPALAITVNDTSQIFFFFTCSTQDDDLEPNLT